MNLFLNSMENYRKNDLARFQVDEFKSFINGKASASYER